MGFNSGFKELRTKLVTNITWWLLGRDVHCLVVWFCCSRYMVLKNMFSLQISKKCWTSKTSGSVLICGMPSL